MKRVLFLLMLGLPVGCRQETPVAANRSEPAAAAKTESPKSSPVPAKKEESKDQSAKPAGRVGGGPSAEAHPAPVPGPTSNPQLPPPEKRPDPPKSDPKSELKELNKEKTLLLDLVPGADGKNKAIRVLFAAEVVQTDAPLEVLVCKSGTKEHEAILRTDIDARYIHAALLAAGAKPGSPVSFYNPETKKPEYKPATGTAIDVLVHYSKGGKVFTHKAQEWILDGKTKKDMAYSWVFAGSKFLKNTDRPNDPDHYCANNGEVISISNFVDSMLDVPVEVSAANDDLIFAAKADRIPPLLSGVWVILEPKDGKR